MWAGAEDDAGSDGVGFAFGGRTAGRLGLGLGITAGGGGVEARSPGEGAGEGLASGEQHKWGEDAA